MDGIEDHSWKHHTLRLAPSVVTVLMFAGTLLGLCGGMNRAEVIVVLDLDSLDPAEVDSGFGEMGQLHSGF